MTADDVSTVRAFLGWAHEAAVAADLSAWLVISEKLPVGGAQKYDSQSWLLRDLEGAARHAVARSGHRQNVYCRVHLADHRIVGNRRGTRADTRWITHFAADVDIAGPGHRPPGGKVLPPDVETAVEFIDATLGPSLIVSSGGGLYPIWRLSGPHELVDDDQRDRLRNIGRRLDRALASHGYHVDATVLDATRIIRPPGVTNHKSGRDPRPVTVLRGWADGAGDYTLEQLDAALPQLPEREKVQTKRDRPPHSTSSAKPAWEVFADRYDVEDVLAADPRHKWHRADDQGGRPAWLRDGSDSDYSIKQMPSGVIVVWSSVIAAELGVEPGDGLDLWGLACRLAGRDATAAARGSAS